MYRRCESANGQGKCEKWGAVVYPKCKAGFSPFGCCICRPAKPNCNALGMNPGIDLSCAKRISIGNPTTADCSGNLQNNAGLCYKACKAGYYGVGPVCWSDAPNGWVGCGMGAAKDSKTCANIILDQVTSVGELALNIATLGSGNAATKAGTTTKNLVKDSAILKKIQNLKAAVKNN